MIDNGMNHPNWDRAERENLEHRSGQDKDDEREGGSCTKCGEFVFEDEECETCVENEEEE